MTDATSRAPDAGPVAVPAGARRALAAAILASAAGFIDGSVTAIALPAIRDSLGASLAGAQWVQAGYLLTLSALTLVGGALGDRFGTARVFGIGILGFTLASLGCGLAPSTAALVAARALQGAFAALMVPGSLALIARTYPEGAARGRAIGLWSAASALTTAAGPVLGGVLLGLGGEGAWRLVFLVNLPLGVLALWLLRPSLARDEPSPERGLDLGGAALATLGLGLLAAGLARAEGSGGALPLAAAGALGLAAFLAWEARTPRPMMPLGLFRDRGFAAANAATLLLYAALSLTLFALPLLLVAGWGLSPLRASLGLLPVAVLISVLSTPMGALAGRTGPFPLIAAGSATVAVAYLWLGIAAHGGSLVRGVLPPVALSGLGMAMVVAPLSAAVMAGAGRAGGVASGINNAVARVAGLVAIAAGGAVAALAYAKAGGPASFGEPSELEGHRMASEAAFAASAWTAAALAAAASLVAFVGLTSTRR